LALSFGIPVLAPRIGEIGSVVGNADDLLYEDSSIENLLRALQRSAKTDLNKLGRTTRMVCNNRSWDTIAQATAEVYKGKTSQKAH
jgi:glycosyltransferase involved in cell wall biosynthesis